jgi:hypothetical protein
MGAAMKVGDRVFKFCKECRRCTWHTAVPGIFGEVYVVICGYAHGIIRRVDYPLILRIPDAWVATDFGTDEVTRE